MSERLEKEEPKVEFMGFKVSASKKQEIIQFVDDRKWNMGAFCRVAVEESMAKVKSEEVYSDEASGD